MFEVLPASVDAAGAEFAARQYRMALEYVGLLGADGQSAIDFEFGGEISWTLAEASAQARAVPRVLLDPRMDHPWPEVAAQAPDARLIVTTDSTVRVKLAGALPKERVLQLAPFCDLSRPVAARRGRDALRQSLARRLGIPAGAPWLFTAGGGEDAALASFRMLARALSRLVSIDWHLVVVCPTAARSAIEACLLALPRVRVRLLPHDQLADQDAATATADLFVWPAVGGVGRHELLRAQALGLAVVACDEPGVADIVHDAMTGRLAPAGNAESFANCIAFLLRQPAFRVDFAAKAFDKVVDQHDLLQAGRRIRGALANLSLLP